MEADTAFLDYFVIKFNAMDVQVNTLAKEIQEAERLNINKKDLVADELIATAKEKLV
ncbi:hypothetical protein M0R04_08040 [Candidatus Dojkabacteria bacterium]|jgi:hypothetical protein|nr:hypothetical protein [Candidatus Dojkabacteria bacterium]